MMSRRSFAYLAVIALAVAVLLVATDPGSAQSRPRFMSGYNSGNGFGFGYGNQYYGANPWGYSGYGFNSPYYGYGNQYYSGYSPWGYSGYGYGNQFYSGYGPGQYSGTWNTPGYRWTGNEFYSGTPSYYGEGVTGDYYSGTTGDYYSSGGGFGSSSGFYGALSGGGMANNVLITVHVPPNAEIFVDDQKTSQTGPIRTFISPPLTAEKNYVYHIRARWTENGQQVDKDRRVDVWAGDRFFVNFIKPRSEGMSGFSSGQQGSDFQTPNTDRSLERSDRTLENQNRNRTENADRAPNTTSGSTNQNRSQTPGTPPPE